jgi:hypothetical protein
MGVEEAIVVVSVVVICVYSVRGARKAGESGLSIIDFFLFPLFSLFFIIGPPPLSLSLLLLSRACGCDHTGGMRPPMECQKRRKCWVGEGGRRTREARAFHVKPSSFSNLSPFLFPLLLSFRGALVVR